MKQRIFMLVWDMDVDKGGLNRAMLNRSAMLSEYYNISLITLDYKNNYKEIEREFLRMGRLHPDVDLLNVHDYYAEKFTKNNQVNKEQLEYYKSQATLYEEGFQVQDNEINTKNSARYFVNGVYKKYKKWTEDGVLTHIDFFDKFRNRICREEFYPNGHLYRKRYYDSTYNKPIQELFYTIDGYCFLNKWYKQNSKQIMYIFLINPHSNQIIKFDRNMDFNAHWLKELSLQEKKKPIVICDGPGSAKVPLSLKSEYIYKTFVIHSNHLDHPHTYGSDVRSDHKEVINKIKDADGVVVLTGRQKKDIIKQFGDFKNIHVIPHSITPMNEVKNITKDPYLFSMVSRLHPEKNIEAAIKAFKGVVPLFPKAKLEIYGEGDDRSRLNALIKENSLEQNVTLEGFSENVEHVYSKSLATILTSIYEGLSLVTLESMACKTPVLAFDVAYGPSDIINDGENGYLIKFNDIDKLTEKMNYLLENPDIAQNLGESAYNHVNEHFNFNKYKKGWLNFLNEFN